MLLQQPDAKLVISVPVGADPLPLVDDALRAFGVLPDEPELNERGVDLLLQLGSLVRRLGPMDDAVNALVAFGRRELGLSRAQTLGTVVPPAKELYTVLRGGQQHLRNIEAGLAHYIRLECSPTIRINFCEGRHLRYLLTRPAIEKLRQAVRDQAKARVKSSRVRSGVSGRGPAKQVLGAPEAGDLRYALEQTLDENDPNPGLRAIVQDGRWACSVRRNALTVLHALCGRPMADVLPINQGRNAANYRKALPDFVKMEADSITYTKEEDFRFDALELARWVNQAKGAMPARGLSPIHFHVEDKRLAGLSHFFPENGDGCDVDRYGCAFDLGETSTPAIGAVAWDFLQVLAVQAKVLGVGHVPVRLAHGDEGQTIGLLAEWPQRGFTFVMLARVR